MKKIIFFLFIFSFAFADRNQELQKKFDPIHRQLFVYANGSFLHKFQGLAIFAYLCSMQYEDSVEGRIQEEIISTLWALSSFDGAVGGMNKFLSGKTKCIDNISEAKAILKANSKSWALAKESMKKEIGNDIVNAKPTLKYIYEEILKINAEKDALEFCDKYLKDGG
ncbi:MAG: hypothetical protein E6R03_11975 [Hyphomicrobiaceae bacterium]|nr:MAG: hypothetical protein E6R03_11975 [Hyphomicrobiaceae bacterium]